MGKSLLNQLMKRLAIQLCNRKIVAKWLLVRWQTVLAMPLVIFRLFGLIIVLMFSTTVSAVGMGGINVTSALGQPLKADIELVAISKAEKDSLVARLASPEIYKNAGLEYPYDNRFKFQIENRADGQPYIKVSSAQPVNDPFVSLLVELTWTAGKLSREYTFLLDPPGYVSEQPAPAQVQAIAPEIQSAVPEVKTTAPAVIAASAVPAMPEETIPVPMEETAPVTASAPEEQIAPAGSAVPPTEQAAHSVPAENVAAVEPAKTGPAEQGAQKTATPENKEWLAVHPGDTMYKLAKQYKLADMSVERMLVAMYRINASQFDGRNMNRIRAGKILHLPSQQELMSVSLPEAVKEIHAQAAEWNVYRQKLASAATVSRQSQAGQQVATGKISSSITDTAPAKESAKEVLKLSKGEAPGDQAGTTGGKSTSTQDKKNAAREEAIASSKALKEEQKRAALLEKNLQDMQRLAQLKAEAAAAVAQPPAKPAANAAAGKATANVVKPPPVILPQPKQAKPSPSLLEQVLEDPLYLAAAAGALLILGGAGFMIYRRKKRKTGQDVTDFIQDVGSVSSRIMAPVAPSPDTGDFTRMPAAQAQPRNLATPQAEHVDAISEADLFLNFGRDAQAEEILKEALQNTPNNHQISLKLLEIYANRKDTNSVAAIARQLQNSGDTQAWQQAAAIGRKLEPNNPLYSGGGNIEDAGNATMQMTAFDVAPETKNVPKPQASALDFDFDVGTATTQQASPSAAPKDAEMDFDITSAKNPGDEQTMDFDITSTNPSMPVPEAPQAAPVVDDLVFDVTGGQAFTSVEAGPKTTRSEGEGGMAFALDFPTENEKVASAPQPDIGLAGINLNFDDVAVPDGVTAENGNKDDHWQDVATKLDLAKAYHEMGDGSGAREILEEVLREGDAAQREAAQNLFKQLG